MKKISLIKKSLVGILVFAFAENSHAAFLSMASHVLSTVPMTSDKDVSGPKVIIKGDLSKKEDTVSKCFYENQNTFSLA